jgi:hypothetical protein
MGDPGVTQGEPVSVYGLLADSEGVDLIVLYASDAGWISQSARHAGVVARSTAPDALSALEPVVAALEGVSQALWERFAQIDNTRFWDWLRTMAGLLLRHPPEQVPQMPDPDLEWIARLGRALEELGDEAISEAVRAEVDAELDAIESALLGDLEGRAAQARFAERRRPDPRQVEAAHHVLATEALSEGSLRGLTRVEPASGAVAVAKWLAAAAALWADGMQRDPADAVVDVPLLQPAHRPIVRRVMAEIAGDADSLAAVVERELHTTGPMRMLCALSDAYFGLRTTIVMMAQRRSDNSVYLGDHVRIAGAADDSTERLIGRELAARSGSDSS